MNMERRPAASVLPRVLGVVLVVLVGLLNFHIPHFFIESAKTSVAGSGLLEVIYAVNLLGALVAAAGIATNARWGWLLGVAIAALSFALYVAQETVGLPGLPKMWLEPSRIVSLMLEAGFVCMARWHLIPGTFANMKGQENLRR
jgi:hypothetical protein